MRLRRGARRHPSQRRISGTVLGWILVVLVLAGVAAAAIFKPSSTNDSDVAARMLAPLVSLPQSGITLGDPSSSQHLAVYADILSSDFGAFEQNVLPELIRRYVRPGRLAIQLRAWPGEVAPGSDTQTDPRLAAESALAASLQDRMWKYLAVLWARYPGYFDSEVQADIFDHTPGLDVRAATRAAKSARVTAAVDRAIARGKNFGFKQPPGFVFDPGGGARAEIIRPARMTASAFVAALDAAQK